MSNKAILLCWILISNLGIAYAQTFSELPVQKVYSLVKDSVNTIGNDTYLDDFYEKLYQLKSTGRGKVNIIHIGDSHIQADYMTDVVRKNFQRFFGNGGRGLIFPLRVAASNEPANYKSTTNAHWNIKRLVYPQQPLPIGICGVTLHTNHAGNRIGIEVKDPLFDYTFDQVSVFYLKGQNSFDFVVKDSVGNYLGTAGAYTGDPFTMVTHIQLEKRIGQMELEVVKTNEDQQQATLFGINLQNSNPGVIYHSIGVNGARFTHYNQASYFARQTQLLQPDLIIVSLGTNDATGYPYVDKQLPNQIETMVKLLEEYNPQAKILLTTPPDAFRKKIKSNPGIQIIREEILKFAVDTGIAFWDMYKVNGGFKSSVRWQAQGLLRPDGIHFSKEGYAYQGSLLFEAIMKSYNRYVPYRHP